MSLSGTHPTSFKPELFCAYLFKEKLFRMRDSGLWPQRYKYFSEKTHFDATKSILNNFFNTNREKEYGIVEIVLL